MLILIRHGESVANAQGLLVGRTDTALTERGRLQAASVPQLLRAPVLALRTSPLQRARDTAALLDLAVPAEIDDRWIEVDYGEYDCQPLHDVPADVWREWRRSPDFRPAGGETLAEVDARVTAACDELFAEEGAGARAPDGDVVVVSHVTPIKAAVAWALGHGVELSWRLHLQTASVSRIGWGNDVPVLHGFDEVAADRGDTPQSRPG
jgi:broad specificity phosphatase PhoE